MRHHLHPVGPDFAESAPLRLVFAGEVCAAPAAVFHALADDTSGWAEWFGAVARARTLQDGAAREIRLRGGGRFEELIVTREPAERFAYRVTTTNVPGIRALLEEWRLTPTGSGTHVQWTIAADGTALLTAALRLARRGLGREFHRAAKALDRRLATADA
jgi:uncharacterized protein YndB with AHSA1/START domain